MYALRLIFLIHKRFVSIYTIRIHQFVVKHANFCGFVAGFQ